MPTLPVLTTATLMPTLPTKATIMATQLTKARWVISVRAPAASGGDHMLRCHQCHLNPAQYILVNAAGVQQNLTLRRCHHCL